MNLDEAVAVYLHLKDVRYADRDVSPAYREACSVLAKYADEAIKRFNGKKQAT